jgi:hypothetical protein
MNAARFRQLALELPEATEGAHQGHADFRVKNKVFASLGPDEDWAMVKLTPETQAERVKRAPEVYEPFAGAWGRQGCTRVVLRRAKVAEVRSALAEAWRNVAPKRLVEEHDDRVE